MKLLLFMSLLFSWNFMFWGAIGLLRLLCETARKHNSILSPLLLWNSVFLFSVVPTRLDVLPSIAYLAVAISTVSWLIYKLNPAKVVIPILSTILAAVCAWLWNEWSTFSAGGTLPSNSLLYWCIVWSFVLLPVVMLLLEQASTQPRSNPTSNSTLFASVSANAPMLIFQLATYFSVFIWFSSESGLLNELHSGLQQTSQETTLKLLALGTFYFYFGIIFPVYIIALLIEESGIQPHLHFMFVTIACIILGFISKTNNNSGSELDHASLTTVQIALTLGLPSLLFAITAQLLQRRSIPATHPHTAASVQLFSPANVAVLIPAFNESRGIELTIRSAIGLVGHDNVFVVNDCSKDNTSDIVAGFHVNLLDLTVNVGKARALDKAIKQFDLCRKFQFLLILDADTEIDKNYLKFALPLFGDHGVAAVAGHAIPKWNKNDPLGYRSFFVAYRIKLYMMTQALLRYGQTTRHLNVSFIVPGFSSIYRTRVIPEIDIAAAGLVIEDFNMTFELHRKNLGRIAYSPNAIAYCDEPHSYSDYTSQIKRWHLGFWQTVLKHGLWRSRFCLSLIIFILESLLISGTLILLPIIAAASLILNFTVDAPSAPSTITTPTLIFGGLLLVFWLDMLSTLIVARICRIPALLWHGLFFIALRWTDALYFIITLPMAFSVESSGRWTSPTRKAAKLNSELNRRTRYVQE